MPTLVNLIRQAYSDDYKGNVAVDPDYNLLHILNWVWNTSTMQPERMKQPVLELTGDLTVTLGDVERLLADQYYTRMKIFAYGSGRIKYITRNTDIAAGETDTDWFCWKFTDVSLPEKEGPRQGAVNDEAAVNGLSWGI
jgi:hypothetical protein